MFLASSEPVLPRWLPAPYPEPANTPRFVLQVIAASDLCQSDLDATTVLLKSLTYDGSLACHA